MIGESLDVAVILSSVKLQGLAAELAGLPILIERVLKEIFLCYCGVEAIEKVGVGHKYLQPRGERGATVEPRIVADSGFVCWWVYSSSRLVTLCLSRIRLPSSDKFKWGEVGQGLVWTHTVVGFLPVPQLPVEHRQLIRLGLHLVKLFVVGAMRAFHVGVQLG